MKKIPPFCPNSNCEYHDAHALPPVREYCWYHRDGYYQSGLHEHIPRYVCRKCGRRFSRQTFSIDYGVKKQVPYRRIFDQISSGTGIRALARQLRVSDKVIINRIGRLARNAIGMHAKVREEWSREEAVVADGFESFTVSQYFPNNIHLVVGKESQYLYGIDYAHLRRKGRMREEQKKRREYLEQYWPVPQGDITRSFTRTVAQIGEYRDVRSTPRITLYTDEKQEYHQVLCTVPWITHRTVSSRLPRHTGNDLFAVNYYDREIRKDQRNHTRETVQFSRDVNNAMERFWVYSAYHNYVKPYRIGLRDESQISHAQKAGIPSRTIRRMWKCFFTRRAFVSTLRLSVSEWFSWFRCYASPMKYVGSWFPQYAAA